MDLTLVKPDLLDAGAWAAVEQHRERLAVALSSSDPAWAIGSAKELVECVARVASQANGVVTPSNADFAAVVNDAHRALGRQAGPGITGESDVKAIADYARKMVLKVSAVRNDWGTGHGHAEIRDIAAEMVSMVASAALLWVRWALTRLEHLILGAPENLISELQHGLVSRRSLREHMDALVMPDQPEDVQHALGVAFGQRSAGGTFVAREVGIDGPAESDDLAAWPAQYRLGAAEGLTLSTTGFLMLGADWVPTVVQIVLPLPPNQIKTFVRGLVEKVNDSGVSPGISFEDLYELAGAIRRAAPRLPEPARADWLKLGDLVDPIDQADSESQ